MIILMGVIGAGKSIQGKLFTDELGYAWISTGNLFRAFITGERRKELFSGKLLSDEEVIDLVKKAFKNIDLNQEFVIDGFPRTKGQTEWLISEIESGEVKLTAIFNLIASEEEVIKRLLARGREDDQIDTIKTRFEEFKSKTLPIISVFKERGIKVIDIDADKSPMEVHKEIISHLPEIG